MNGNDLLEHEEAHREELEKDFLMQFSHSDLKDFILLDESSMERFIQKESRRLG